MSYGKINTKWCMTIGCVNKKRANQRGRGYCYKKSCGGLKANQKRVNCKVCDWLIIVHYLRENKPPLPDLRVVACGICDNTVHEKCSSLNMAWFYDGEVGDTVFNPITGLFDKVIMCWSCVIDSPKYDNEVSTELNIEEMVKQKKDSKNPDEWIIMGLKEYMVDRIKYWKQPLGTQRRDVPFA